MKFPDIGFIILSLFCAGGLVAYVRETLRLRRLITRGRITRAVIMNKEKIEGSESVVHYLVTYRFNDAEGKTETHEQDLNSLKFFDSLSEGEELEILYQAGGAGSSYPLSQIKGDQKVSSAISAGILLLWLVMGIILY